MFLNKIFVSFRYLSIFVVHFLVLFITTIFKEDIQNQETQAENSKHLCKLEVSKGFQCLIVLRDSALWLPQIVSSVSILYLMFLPSYDVVAQLTETTSFLSNGKLICFCFRLRAYGLFEFLKIFENVEKKSVVFELCYYHFSVIFLAWSL